MSYVNYSKLFESEEKIGRAMITVLKKRGIKLDLSEFKSTTEFQSYKKKNSVSFWNELCHVIVNKKSCHQDTYDKYIERLHKKVNRSFDSIKTKFNKF